MNLFDSYEKISDLNKVSSEWKTFRRQAREAFEKSGLPTRQNEQWKYTNLKTIADLSFDSSLLETITLSSDDMQQIKQRLNSNFYNLVFVNGELQESLSSQELLEGLVVEKFKNILAGNPSAFLGWKEVFEKLSLSISTNRGAFDHLNEAFIGQGIAINVKPEVVLQKPLHLLFFTTTTGFRPLAIQPRVWIMVGCRSKATILESYFGREGAYYLNNVVVEVVAQDSSSLEYLRVQDDAEKSINIGHTQIYLKKNSNLESLAMSVGAKLSRHSLDIYHLERGSNSRVHGIYISNKRQQMDHYTNIDHVVGACQSQQHYKGILDGESRAVFNGRVSIRKGADQANSEQLNNNLILNPLAEIDTKPQLEIYADDVKATHGSTVGQLNKEEIFYLESRAIPKEVAIKMLSYGFVAELIYKISNINARHWFEEILTEKYQKISEIGDL